VQINWTISHAKRIDIIKISILPEATYRFSAISIKIPMVFFRTKRKEKRKEKAQRAKVVFREKNKAGGIRLPDFKL